MKVEPAKYVFFFLVFLIKIICKKKKRIMKINNSAINDHLNQVNTYSQKQQREN